MCKNWRSGGGRDRGDKKYNKAVYVILINYNILFTVILNRALSPYLLFISPVS
jgi:hypothetical protein